MMRKVVQTIILCVFAVTLVNGQKQKNEVFLTGTVYDQVGDVCPEAKVIATNGKGKQFEATTDKDGNYRLPLRVNVFKPGGDLGKTISKYSIKVTLPGFKVTEITGLKFAPNKSGIVRLDVILEVGLLGDS